MKKLFLILLCGMSMTSCYNTKLLVGDVKPNEPLVKVNREWNHHLIGGLVPLGNTKMKTSEYVDGRANYVVKTNVSFLNMLVSYLTCGIYAPSQTTYYLPLKEVQSK